jgi:hypothetical protein
MNPRAARCLTLAAVLAALALPAGAAVLYKWVDAEGKTQYSDRPPKGFKGEVIRIDAEPDKGMPGVAPPAAPTLPSAARDKEGEDIGLKRRAARTQLEARLAQARAKVEDARKALETAEPGADERQVVQQRNAGGGMHGMTARSNCREEGTGKSKVLMCPTMIQTDEYRDRIARLEADLRKAEEELAEAERAWRRGVD